jgi:hypothetical protein
LNPRSTSSSWSVGPDAVEHLKLEPFRPVAALCGQRDYVVDKTLVVRRDAQIRASGQRSLEEAPVPVVDVALAWVRDVRTLEVRPLDEAKVRGEREQSLEIVGRAVEVRLQHAAHVVAAALTQAVRRV